MPLAQPTEPPPPPLDRASPQLTARAVLTGMLLGSALSLCNVYAGLKIGWGFNMSITAALLSYAFWQLLHRAGVARPWGLLENNVNQTAASAAASISSAGLVSAIPALTMLTGRTLPFHWLALWTFAVSAVGVVVGIGLRRQLLIVDKLRFPGGVATAETVREMYAHGREALARVAVLVGAAVVAAAGKLTETLLRLPHLALPGHLGVRPGGALAARGLASISLKNLTFSLDPSLLMVGIGALIGFRAAASLMLGAVLAWGVVAPRVLERGWVQPGPAGASWYGAALPWLLWPGVAMMVAASLTSFAFSWRSVVAALRGRRAGAAEAGDGGGEGEGDVVPRRWFLAGLLAATVLAVACQVALFDIGFVAATVGVLLTFVLAIVAGRVSGETGITPVGAMGKVTQLLFGVIAPGNPAANLMAANVTGGAASQTADLLHDLKTGLLIGASPRKQAAAQAAGVAAGALAGSAGYLLLVPEPGRMLLTDEWPAPAVASWRAVAQLFMRGAHAMPPGAVGAILWGGGAGVVLAVLEKTLPKRAARFVPSPASVGLAFVIPAYNALSMFAGGALALAAGALAPRWSARFVVVLAAGLVAGESLMGVGIALRQMLLR